jgi:hypothetical protein
MTYKPNSVVGNHLSGLCVATKLKRHSAAKSCGTALHRSKDFAVSPELNRFVTVRTSTVTGDGNYPLPLRSIEASFKGMRAVFGLSSRIFVFDFSNKKFEQLPGRRNIPDLNLIASACIRDLPFVAN